MDWQYGGILGTIHLILFLIALYEIISSSRPVVNKVLWGLLIFLLPCMGLIIYYLIGRKGVA
jgi:hypothetical protein